MKNYPYFAIEIVNEKSYCIKKVISDGFVVPYNFKGYKTLEQAQEQARQDKLIIESVGSFYKII